MTVASAGNSQDGRFAGDERLRKAERLRKRPDYLRAQRRGDRRAGAHLIVYARTNGRDWSRLGVTASRKVGKAHTRNWWKRRIRDIFRRNKAEVPVGYDFVVIVKASADQPDFEELRAELLGLFDRAASKH